LDLKSRSFDSRYQVGVKSVRTGVSSSTSCTSSHSPNHRRLEPMDVRTGSSYSELCTVVTAVTKPRFRGPRNSFCRAGQRIALGNKCLRWRSARSDVLILKTSGRSTSGEDTVKAFCGGIKACGFFSRLLDAGEGIVRLVTARGGQFELRGDGLCR